jgi:transposase
MSKERKQSTETAVREIRRRTRRKFSPDEKVRIVLKGLRGEQSVSELCRREGIAANLYYRWSTEFLEGIRHSSWVLAQRPSMGVMLNP